ncbi:hypothetical protein Tco_0277882, partial [Tanacetum coccineum]
MEFMGSNIKGRYSTRKFLRSLLLQGIRIALSEKLSPDIDKIDIDDLYNNLRVYEDELKRSSDEESTLVNNRSSKEDRYKAVPPPITGNFLTPRADISFAGLYEYAIRNKIIESQTIELNTKTSETTGKTNYANTKKPKSISESVVSNPKINRDSVIIEDWNSDDEEEGYEMQTVRPELTMSSVTSDVTYTSVYTDSEPGRAFWGANDEEISEGGIPRVIVLGFDRLPLLTVPQDEDEREPMFIQAHDPDYVPEPIYPEYIPLEDDHEFPAEEQPLPPIDSPTTESPGYVTESDPEEDPEEYEDDETEDGPVDYPMDGGDDGDDGDDDDGDSSGDDARDEDEDEEDEEDEEEEEHLAPADSTVIPADEPVFPPEGTEPIIPPPSTDIAGERLSRCTASPVHSPPLPPSSG